MALQPYLSVVLLCVEISWSHTTRHTRQDSSGRVISPSQRPLPTQGNTTYKHKRQTSIPSAGFEPAILATKRPQTYALDLAVTGISNYFWYSSKFLFLTMSLELKSYFSLRDISQHPLQLTGFCRLVLRTSVALKRSPYALCDVSQHDLQLTWLPIWVMSCLSLKIRYFLSWGVCQHGLQLTGPCHLLVISTSGLVHASYRARPDSRKLRSLDWAGPDRVQTFLGAEQVRPNRETAD
jgi:hypothetical protein